jgi:hypothetical protein
MIFSHHADKGDTTAVWQGTGMVGHRNDGLTQQRSYLHIGGYEVGEKKGKQGDI